MLYILHNPRCRKSRETLQLIEESGQDVTIVDYLQNTPTKEAFLSVLNKLEMKPSQLIRRNESIYKEQFKGNEYSEEEWLDILLSNPKLIERPIVYNDKQAVVGRPPENVRKLL